MAGKRSEEHLGRHHAPEVRQRHLSRESAVDEGTVYEEVCIVEAVFEDCDPRGPRDGDSSRSCSWLSRSYQSTDVANDMNSSKSQTSKTSGYRSTAVGAGKFRYLNTAHTKAGSRQSLQSAQATRAAARLLIARRLALDPVLLPLLSKPHSTARVLSVTEPATRRSGANF